MFQINKFELLLLTFLLTCMAGCVNEAQKKPDVSHIKVGLKVHRTEADFFNATNATDLLKVREKDSVFFDLYVNHMIGDISGGSRANWEEKSEQLMKYVTHEDVVDLLSECQKKYADFGEYEVALTDAFKLYKHYFPKREVPAVYTFVAPFRAAHPCWENGLGIALDMYLGQDFSPYYAPSLEFPQYQIRKMRPDFLVPNAMKAWLLSEFLPPSESGRMIDEMVYSGKILYALSLILPEAPDSMLIGYPAGKIEFCEDQESQIWENIITNKMLYSTDRMAYRGYLGDGPFSTGPGVPQEAPPGIGDWAGWRMIQQFMKKQAEMSLEELFSLPADRILKDSGYKP